MKVAVVGAGIFGCVSAIKLAEAGHKVYLFDKKKSILSCASAINQFRIHRGYHYPRSKETVEYVKESSLIFEEEFHTAICREGYNRYYAISNTGSLISTSDYLSFLESSGLKYSVTNVDKLSILKKQSIDLLVEVEENSFDSKELYLSITTRLARSKVYLRTNREFHRGLLTDFDIVVNATYNNINVLLDAEDQIEYQYELCEKPVVRLSNSFKNTSVVVLDGEFCCVDPFGFLEDYQVIGHVKEAIHERQVGKLYTPPIEFLPLMNNGIVFSNLSKFDRIWNGFTEYFNVDEVSYKGSMYTVRTVLPQHEHDDARPSTIIKHKDNLYSIFSGKIGTCVDIANKLVNQI